MCNIQFAARRAATVPPPVLTLFYPNFESKTSIWEALGLHFGTFSDPRPHFGPFWRPGPILEDFPHENVLPFGLHFGTRDHQNREKA